MKSRHFKMYRSGKKGEQIEVFAENFLSSAELLEICCNRTDLTPPGKYKDHDYFVTCDTPLNSAHWSDFKSKGDLFNLIENGVKDEGMLKDVRKYASKAQCEEKDKLSKKCMDVVGGGVDVPAFLSGTPECMYGLKRKKIRSRIVKVAVYAKALANISASDYQKAGMLIAKTVAKIEKAGYRVRLVAVDGYCDRNTRKMWILSSLVKRENEPINYRRILFPMTRMAFHRGVGFGWMARNGSDEIYGLGGHLEDMFPYDEQEVKMEELMDKACGRGEGEYTTFAMSDIIGLMHSHGDEWTEKYLDSKMLSLS